MASPATGATPPTPMQPPSGENASSDFELARSPGPAAAVSTQRARSFLNHHQRLEIIKKKEQEPRWTQTQLARWAMVHFNLPKEPSQATIAVLLKKRDQLKAATVRPQTRTIRAPRHPELEAALLLWVRFLQSKRVAFTGENIRLKAAALATQMGIQTTMNFSTGWMSGFVARHNLLLARAHKKKLDDANDDEALRSIMDSYDPCNVFAMDESALVYNDLPAGLDHLDQANTTRDRICVGLAVNMDSSEKLEPLVVTTSHRKVDVCVERFFNVEGTMTAQIFEQWLHQLNQRMASVQRKIALLVDSAPSHFPMQLSHVKLVLLSPKLSPRSQPFKVGVMKTFKALYRRRQLSFAVDQAEERRSRIFDVNLAQALQWVKQAWSEVSNDLIRSCWARTGLIVSRGQIFPAEGGDINPEVVQSIVVSLSQLQMLDAVTMETLLNPRSEEDVHYVYDDSTILRIVAGETQVDEVESSVIEPSAVNEDRRDDGSHTHAPVDVPQRDGTNSNPTETPPTVEELLANYRGVIWSLDADANRSEECISALRFLRRKQVALQLVQQQSLASTASPSPGASSLQLPPDLPVPMATNIDTI